jgi:N-acyl-D-aspartate/D-glutamate deacylase
VRTLALLLSVALSATACTTVTFAEADLLVRGGTIYPGDGEPFVGDVAVRDGRILAVGPALSVSAASVIDARGMIVTPGFIDPHTHMGDWVTSDDPQRRLVEPFLAQGVTTAIFGNDGGGPIEFDALFGGASERPTGINFAAFTGFGTIRQAVIGDARRAPSAEELDRQKALVRSAMCAGALGLSTGLFYAPQSFSETAEVIELARVAGTMGGLYDTHLRDESNYTVGLSAAIEEAIVIAREAQVPVHISHIKALGVDLHGWARAIVARIEKARAEGLEITASQYPWTASGTSMTASLMPLWALDGGRAAMLERLGDPAYSVRLRDEITENLRRRGGPKSLLVVEGRWKGRTLDQIAAASGTDPLSAAQAVIRTGDVAVVSFNMDEGDVASFMRQPWTFTGSDASPGHPRTFGSFARKYAIYVKERKTLTLREFIDRSTALTADLLGLRDRGRIRRGAFADIAVFDPAEFAARATYEEPELTATGMRAVIVNGELALADGSLTGVAAGRALRHSPPVGTCPGQSR